MLRIGLTGGIGSGKSTVSDYFEQLGITVIDSDRLAFAATQPGTSGYQQICARYGVAILTDTQQIDRRRLREIIFSDVNEKIWLESLLHPEIQRMRESLQRESKTPYTISVIPLLVENNLMELFDRILLVDTPIALQQSRASARDCATPESIAKIMKSQSHQLKRLIIANDVITNDSHIEHLHQQIRCYHEYYGELSLCYSRPR